MQNKSRSLLLAEQYLGKEVQLSLTELSAASILNTVLSMSSITAMFPEPNPLTAKS